MFEIDDERSRVVNETFSVWEDIGGSLEVSDELLEFEQNGMAAGSCRSIGTVVGVVADTTRRELSLVTVVDCSFIPT